MMEATLLMFSVLFVHLYLHHVDLLKFATFVYNLWEEVELGISFFSFRVLVSAFCGLNLKFLLRNFLVQFIYYDLSAPDPSSSNLIVCFFFMFLLCF